MADQEPDVEQARKRAEAELWQYIEQAARHWREQEEAKRSAPPYPYNLARLIAALRGVHDEEND